MHFYGWRIMKILRRLGLVAGVLLLLVGIAVAALFALFDENKLKAQLIDGVYASTQRKLAIDGGLALSVWPDLGVRVGRLTLTERGNDTPFASVESARLPCWQQSRSAGLPVPWPVPYRARACRGRAVLRLFRPSAPWRP